MKPMSQQIQDYAHPEVLVSTQWLADHLNDEHVRMVEVDMSPEPYANAHLPGAVFWNILTDLLKPDLSQNLDGEAIAQLLSRSGITPATTVIAYGSYPGTGAWIFWLLKLLGHQSVRVLNGGHQKWTAEGRPVAASCSAFEPTHYPSQALDSSLRVSVDVVKEAIADPQRIVLDVRSIEEYRGEQYLMSPPKEGERAGHIMGAIHLEHLQTLQPDGTFKSKSDLQMLYTRHGITPDKTVFPYCAIGARSACIWFVLKYLLGYSQVRNYDGSWNEWSRLPDAPYETAAQNEIAAQNAS